MAKKHPAPNYRNGTVFAVPLRDGGFALGLVARSNGKGLVFGYFFGPRLASIENHVRIMTPRVREQAVYVGQFGDLGLIKGEWPVLGAWPDWRPDEWPMPPFARHDALGEHAYVSIYDEETFALVREHEIASAEVSDFVADGVMGYGAMETRLSKLLPQTH